MTLPPCELAGRIVSAKTPLPGVAVELYGTDAVELAASSTRLDGSFSFSLPGPGRYRLRADLGGFAPVERELTLAADPCRADVDLEMQIASRAARTPVPTPAHTIDAPAGKAPVGGPGAGTPPVTRQRFQDLSVSEDASAEVHGQDPAGRTDDAPPDVSLPPGMTADTAVDSVALSGAPAQTAEDLLFRDRMSALDAAGGDLEVLRERMREAAFRGAGGAGRDLEAGIGRMAGGIGEGRGPAGGLFGGPRGTGDRLQGSASYVLSGSSLDAQPYALNGRPPGKASYAQHRYSASLGGPLRIPKLYQGAGTSFFLSVSGSRARRPYDTYSTVPTVEAREGDLSAFRKTLYDPLTGQPFPGNLIPATRIEPAARTLLSFLPLPNEPGAKRNYHYVTALANRSDQVGLRLTQTFGASETKPGRRTTGRARPRGRVSVRRRPTLNLAVDYSNSAADTANGLPTLGGETRTSTWDVPVSFSFPTGGFFHQSRVAYNRNRTESRGLYAGNRDVVGETGIRGVSGDPFDWGVPSLSFTTIADLRDVTPSRRLTERLSISHTLMRTLGRHTLRFGGQFGWEKFDSRTDPNARGSFVFTGLYTAARNDGKAVAGSGLDFADFLLGLPQQASLQLGSTGLRFRSSSWSLFLQDDWRPRSNVSLSLGLRYEYASPFREIDGRAANLDVTPTFTAAAPVLPGGIGPFTGVFPATLINPDRDNFAPRVGGAWKPSGGLTVRAGFGVNYTLGGYAGIAQRLANQPPFASTATALGAPDSPVLLSDSFAGIDQWTTANSFGIDKNYRQGAVAIWSLDVQKELGRSLVVSAGYTGSRGYDLDLQRAPNRGPSGLRIADVAPFIWQSSGGHSILHSAVLRVRRRLSHGVALGATYVFGKSIDDASSIGGGGVTVAQDDLNLAAERGRSSFDRRHRLNADLLVELPFGAGRRWAKSGVLAGLLGGWVCSGTLNAESGAPFTARVRGDFADVSRGVNGTLRADVTGQPVSIDDPSLVRWFNTGAFVIPAPGTFGDAGRNTISGPGTFLVNLAITRNVTFGRTRNASIRVQAANLFNTPQLTRIDTVVNSPTFGQVVAVGPMRSLQIQTRLRF